MNFIKRKLIEIKDNRQKVIEAYKKGVEAGQNQGFKKFSALIKEKTAMTVAYSNDISVLESNYKAEIHTQSTRHADEIRALKEEHSKMIDALRETFDAEILRIKNYYEEVLSVEKEASFRYRAKIDNEYQDRCKICSGELDKAVNTVQNWKEDMTRSHFTAEEMQRRLLNYIITLQEHIGKFAATYGMVTKIADQVDLLGVSMSAFSKETMPNISLSRVPVLPKAVDEKIGEPDEQKKYSQAYKQSK